MTEQEILSALARGLTPGGIPFHPVAYFTQVEEPEFGCEGRPDGAAVFAVLRGYDAAGAREWRLPEEELWRSGLDEGMFLGFVPLSDGTPWPCTLRTGAGACVPAKRGPWLARFFRSDPV